MTDFVQLTKDGMAALKTELKNLVEEERPDILRRLAEARAHGDLSENAEYHAAKERKAIIVARISELNDVLMRAEVFEATAAIGKGKCIFGSVVVVAKLDEDGEPAEKRSFQLVHQLEADSGKSRLSISSPLGRALLDKEVGDIIDLEAPAGTIEYEVLEISYPGD